MKVLTINKSIELLDVIQQTELNLETSILNVDCFEIGFTPILNGETGISFCNLNEINAGQCKTEEDFYRACKTAAVIGTLQAGYTDFPFLGKLTEDIVKYESLLGVSITGWMTSPWLFNPEVLEKGAAIVKETNEIIAEIININPAARLTTTKPSGNSCQTFTGKIKTERGDMSLAEIFDFCAEGTDVYKQMPNDSFISITTPLKVYDENNQLSYITNLYMNGLTETYDIEFEDGNIYSFTENHKLKTISGWKYVKDISEDDEIISFD